MRIPSRVRRGTSRLKRRFAPVNRRAATGRGAGIGTPRRELSRARFCGAGRRADERGGAIARAGVGSEEIALRTIRPRRRRGNRGTVANHLPPRHRRRPADLGGELRRPSRLPGRALRGGRGAGGGPRRGQRRLCRSGRAGGRPGDPHARGGRRPERRARRPEGGGPAGRLRRPRAGGGDGGGARQYRLAGAPATPGRAAGPTGCAGAGRRLGERARRPAAPARPVGRAIRAAARRGGGGGLQPRRPDPAARPSGGGRGGRSRRRWRGGRWRCGSTPPCRPGRRSGSPPTGSTPACSPARRQRPSAPTSPAPSRGRREGGRRLCCRGCSWSRIFCAGRRSSSAAD